jgi:Secretion system C-terminal sorting domain
MKTNATQTFVIKVILFVFLSLYFFTAFGQPDYTFKNGVHISGPSGYQVGSVYQFSEVKPGVDATITIAAISSGIVVNDLDAGSGYDEALQPTLTVEPFTKGHLEMYFELFVGGSNIPYTALEMPVTCIDVDGVTNHDGNGNPLNEFDEVDLGGGYFETASLGGELMISQVGSWFIGKNTFGVDYPGRDTSAKQVMFSVINANVSTFTIKVGADNQSALQGYRLRSVYFKKFSYPHFLLPLPKMLDFSGTGLDNKIMLNWKMESGGEWNQCLLERADISGRFESIAVFLPTNVSATDYSYTDHTKETGNYYYRLKLTSTEGEIKYSNTLAFKTGNKIKEDMSVYPSLVTDQFTVKLNAEKEEAAQLQVFDYSGKQVYKKAIILKKGENNIAVNDFSAQRGNFIVALRSAYKTHSQKIIVQ